MVVPQHARCFHMWAANIYVFFLDMPCTKRVYGDITRASVQWSAARNKEGFSSQSEIRDGPVMNQLSTVISFPHSVEIGCRLYVFWKNPSSPKPGHTMGESHRGARRGGGAGSGRTGCQQNCSPRGQSFFLLSKASKTRRLNVSLEARTNEILCKSMEEQNPRLTSGSSAVYPRFISGTRSALSFWLPTSGPTPFFVSVNPFHARHVGEPCFGVYEAGLTPGRMSLLESSPA